VNVRDLGGLPAAGGGTIAPHRLVRADNIRRLTPEGWRELERHGVVRIVDLRFPEELAEDAPGDAPVEVVHLSVLGESRTDEWQDRQWAAMDAAADAHAYLVWSYGAFLDGYRDRFAAAVQAVADAPDGAVLVHCVGGKDRTGLIVALALRVAGVEPHTVAEDYALSEAALVERSDAWIAAAADDVERRRRELLGPTPPSAMVEVLEGLEERYGSVEDYLRGGGMTDEALARLRRRLRA
jgi:protein tyrosine/serine phosphatase